MDEHGGFERMSVVGWARRDAGTTLEEAATIVSRPEPGPGHSTTGDDGKYRVLGPIGRGGMGEVMLVEDRDLRREIAMKVMIPDLAGHAGHRLKFVAEAQATSQLEHPGIPPVHDMGVSSEGQVYFTMKLVRGDTLRDVLKDLFVGSRAARKQYNLHRLISILERIAEALHFAHEKGVVHRDLKPENVMLGEFGEVHVMDWGLAKVGVEAEDDDSADPVATEGTDAGLETQYGTVKGTIPYMSPEQACGDTGRVDRRTDVYAMGCVLYEMLTLHRAFEEGGASGLFKVQTGAFPSVRDRNPKRLVPASLGELCERAMKTEPADRPQTAAEFGAELREWLDGRAERDRRHRDAERLAAEGKEAAARYRRMKAQIVEAEDAAEAEAAKFKPWQPFDEKLPLHLARERVEELKTQVALAFADTTRLFDAALVAEEGNATARAAMADLWKDRMEEAEQRGEKADTAHAEAMVRRYDDGRLAEFLTGDGTLELSSDPPGAEVVLHRFEDHHGILKPTEGEVLGTTPIDPITLPMGSYLCLLRQDGYRDVRYPVHIARGTRWKGAVRMRTDDEIGEDFVYVPGGPFVYGEGKSMTERTLPDFMIQKYPVTFRQWGEFLAAVEAETGIEAAAALIPSVKGDGEYMERAEDGVYRALQNNIEGPARERCVREYGADLDGLLPVAGVSWQDANAYCAWKSNVTGQEWRLPSEEEREKAARGVDGRRFPWGDAEDASLCKNSEARDEPPQPEPVGTFPTAVSVYGMGDAAGNSWDWTSSLFGPHVQASENRVNRGGSWNNTARNARSANRSRSTPGLRYSNLGFRPARSVTAG